jgi:uncharacterized membrane protein YgdD (TMEM256/DUF423 family)
MSDSRSTTTDRLIALAALLGASGVAVGAFGAHALRSMLATASDSSTRLGWWDTAARYHLAHALAVGLVALAYERKPSRALLVSAALFTLGVIVFAGTLDAMALGAPRWLGAITPIGGASLIAAWITLACCSLWPRRSVP